MLIALVALVFAGGLGTAFVWDDPVDILGNPSAQWATFWDRLPVMNRPLTKFTYALNDALHGAWAPGYAAVNLALHLTSSALVLVLLRRAFRDPASWWPLAIAGVWAVHPALTESVTYLSGRAMVLSSALTLGALAAATGARPRPVLAFVCALLAPLARETALILPLILLWWQWTVGRDEDRRAMRALPVWLGVVIAATVLALMQQHRHLVAFSLQVRDPVTALRGNVQAAADIIAYWLTPWRVTIMPQAPLNYFWTEWQTLVRVAGFAAAGFAALALRKRAPLAAFALGLTLLALAPSNTFIWRLDPVALKPLYLSGIGLTLLAGLALMALPRRTGLALAAILVIALGAATVARVMLFASPVTLWADAVAKTPENGRAWINYGAALMGDGRMTDAAAALETGLELLPHDLLAQRLIDELATIRGVEVPAASP